MQIQGEKPFFLPLWMASAQGFAQDKKLIFYSVRWNEE
jgi:hypothetical protein